MSSCPDPHRLRVPLFAVTDSTSESQTWAALFSDRQNLFLSSLFLTTKREHNQEAEADSLVPTFSCRQISRCPLKAGLSAGSKGTLSLFFLFSPIALQFESFCHPVNRLRLTSCTLTLLLSQRTVRRIRRRDGKKRDKRGCRKKMRTSEVQFSASLVKERQTESWTKCFLVIHRTGILCQHRTRFVRYGYSSGSHFKQQQPSFSHSSASAVPDVLTYCLLFTRQKRDRIPAPCMCIAVTNFICSLLLNSVAAASLFTTRVEPLVPNEPLQHPLLPSPSYRLLSFQIKHSFLFSILKTVLSMFRTAERDDRTCLWCCMFQKPCSF